MYRCEIVTPAGRRRYLEILYKHLKSQRADFAVWQLWQNTKDAEDIAYMNRLAAENDWITVVKPSWPYEENYSICKFFQYTKREDTIYIRLDDDIVFLSPNFIKELVAKRIEMPQYLFIYPNIINNAIISHLHHRNNLIDFNGLAGYECMDQMGWNNPQFCEKLHRAFINDVKSGNMDKWKTSYNLWVCKHFERVSINCICWFGKDMNHSIVTVERDEEVFLSCDSPRRLNRYNALVSSPICVHYAFFTQRKHIDGGTDILALYTELSNSLKME